MYKVFAASLLLVIQFCLKNDTKYSNFLLIPYVYGSSSNKISTVVGFVYKHMPFNINFTLLVSYILTNSTFRS